MELRQIDKNLLPAFLPYLSDEAAQAIRESWGDTLAFGSVTDDFHTCGAVCGFTSPEGLVLVSLNVDPKTRRQGVATLLLDKLEEQSGAPVASAAWFAPETEQVGLRSLLEQRGLTVELEDAPVMRLDSLAMAQLPVCRRAFLPTFRPDPHVVPISEITDEEYAEVLRDETIPEGLRLNDFDPEVLKSPYSMGYRYKGVISAYFLALPLENCGVIKAVVSRSMSHPAAFFQMMAAALHLYQPCLHHGHGGYWMETINDASEKLARFACKGHLELWYRGQAQREASAL